MDWLLEIWVIREVIRPVLDILLLAFILYQGYNIFLQTRALQLVKGALLMVPIYLFAWFFKLNTLLWLLNLLAPGIFIGIAIVFQPELRKIFIRIGQGEWFKSQIRATHHQVESVLNAVDILSGRQKGCLLTFVRSVGLNNIIETGTRLDAELTTSLILTIFGHETPLHDGALVIQGGRIAAAGCFLPLSDQSDIRSSFGTRHRAALGLAEESDAIVLVVSEETGAISVAYDSELHYDLSIDQVRGVLKDLLDYREDVSPEEENVFED